MNPLKSALLAIGLVSGGLCAPVALAATPAAQTSPDYQQKLTLAKEVIRLEGTEERMKVVMDDLINLMTKAIAADTNVAALPKVERDKLIEFLIDDFKTNFLPELLDTYAKSMADYYTVEELQALVEVYKSPVMQKHIRFATNAQMTLRKDGERLGQDMAKRAVTRWLEWRKTQKK